MSHSHGTQTRSDGAFVCLLIAALLLLYGLVIPLQLLAVFGL